MTQQVHGYRHGDRVRDKRDGSIGTMYIIHLTDDAAEESAGTFREQHPANDWRVYELRELDRRIDAEEGDDWS